MSEPRSERIISVCEDNHGYTHGWYADMREPPFLAGQRVGLNATPMLVHEGSPLGPIESRHGVVAETEDHPRFRREWCIKYERALAVVMNVRAA